MHDDIDIQAAFERSVLTNTLEDIFVETSDMGARLGVYRRNFMQGHCKVLRTTFAMTAAYLGDSFDYIAVEYICQNRPKAGELFAVFGASFPGFLTDPIAQDLAVLERALQTVIIAKCDVGGMPRKTVDAYWQLRSDVQLIECAHNVEEIYRTLKTMDSVGEIKNDTHYYAVYIKHETPVIQPLSSNEYRVLDVLRTPHQIDELLDKLTFCQETFVNLLPSVFTVNYLKVADVSIIHDSKMC